MAGKGHRKVGTTCSGSRLLIPHLFSFFKEIFLPVSSWFDFVRPRGRVGTGEQIGRFGTMPRLIEVREPPDDNGLLEL
ncbi:unnamed protein product [Pleuronectes platessa]|uniref:Uncharacterized protein n=1 Tax=Pleuronectes platessa TaxID=8262 RepID=A0A9N7YGH8_PLEPL|nr:unnamed protein product [Pleuronectes platessa]